MAAKDTPSEDQEQAWLVAWLRREHPSVRIFAIPNGGGRSKAQGAILKATGTSAGVPDLMLPAPRGKYHGLFVEMKRTKGGTVSADQKTIIAKLRAVGYQVLICKGADDAKRQIVEFLNQENRE